MLDFTSQAYTGVGKVRIRTHGGFKPKFIPTRDKTEQRTTFFPHPAFHTVHCKSLSCPAAGTSRSHRSTMWKKLPIETGDSVCSWDPNHDSLGLLALKEVFLSSL